MPVSSFSCTFPRLRATRGRGAVPLDSVVLGRSHGAGIASSKRLTSVTLQASGLMAAIGVDEAVLNQRRRAL
jgi:hypothetical protein